MRVVIQRVSEAKVTVDRQTVGKIGRGLLVLVGITETDNATDIAWLSNKILNLRVFPDAEGTMNLSVENVGGQLLVVSQFTLYASTKKGNRPSYLRSAKPNIAIPIYEKFIDSFAQAGIRPKEGLFGASMKISLVNDGPVTITIDSKDRE